ncbi:MAG: AAA family ATPase [Tissierellia bacterium]|nr:AAA family ATPase [Tissierellia bacterium]
MILKLKNIGKIETANVELNGITVVAGENDTGKSTVGKILFCIFNSFYKIEQQIDKERENIIKSILDNYYQNVLNIYTRRFYIDEVASNILHNTDIYKNNMQLLEKDISESFMQNEDLKKYIDKVSFDKIAKNIFEIISISDEIIFETVLSKRLDAEFNGQVNNIYSNDKNGVVELNIKDTNVEILIKDNKVSEISNNFSLNTEVIYMDDPFAIDELNLPRFVRQVSNYTNHRDHLKSKLYTGSDGSVKGAIYEIRASNKIYSILSKINTISSGEMIRTKGYYGYKVNNLEAILDIKNISTGLKTFVIIKTLLLNGSLEENGTIILDEPEIHLHPEWQLILAELIVLIQKEFGMHILLNTHSPYFLRAIQVYSAKYEIADKCKYYMSENIEDNKAIIRDVTTSIDEVYSILARPLEELEIERYTDD